MEFVSLFTFLPNVLKVTFARNPALMHLIHAKIVHLTPRLHLARLAAHHKEKTEKRSILKRFKAVKMLTVFILLSVHFVKRSEFRGAFYNKTCKCTFV